MKYKIGDIVTWTNGSRRCFAQIMNINEYYDIKFVLNNYTNKFSRIISCHIEILEKTTRIINDEEKLEFL